MNIYVYSDESGVFDKKYNEYFVFGGLIFLDKEEKDNIKRKFYAIEKEIKINNNLKIDTELKASKISFNDKKRLYKSLSKVYKFCVIVNQKKVNDNIFDNKKSKQRFLDYAFKIGLKNAFKNLINRGEINSGEVKNIYVYCDEHTTATNGKYELKEALEQEFKIGTFNYEYQIFYNPIFRNLKTINLKFLNSEKENLIRASDIVANTVYNHVNKKEFHKIDTPFLLSTFLFL